MEFPQGKNYELRLLLTGGPELKELKAYLSTYIERVLDRFAMSSDEHQRLYDQLNDDIPVAARRYLQNKANKQKFKFSAYFSWYISERLNKIPGLKRKPEDE